MGRDQKSMSVYVSRDQYSNINRIREWGRVDVSFSPRWKTILLRGGKIRKKPMCAGRNRKRTHSLNSSQRSLNRWNPIRPISSSLSGQRKVWQACQTFLCPLKDDDIGLIGFQRFNERWDEFSECVLFRFRPAHIGFFRIFPPLSKMVFHRGEKLTSTRPHSRIRLMFEY